MPENTHEDWIEVVRRKVAGIRFGSVQITVHEGRVTQVESTEKTRIASEAAKRAEPSAD
ncbi:MAG: hypothetical protein RL088_2203 [Verrucomicrobiota bacterium]|jgi:hypothetical protein